MHVASFVVFCINADGKKNEPAHPNFVLLTPETPKQEKHADSACMSSAGLFILQGVVPDISPEDASTWIYGSSRSSSRDPFSSFYAKAMPQIPLQSQDYEDGASSPIFWRTWSSAFRCTSSMVLLTSMLMTSVSSAVGGSRMENWLCTMLAPM